MIDQTRAWMKNRYEVRGDVTVTPFPKMGSPTEKSCWFGEF